jgi:hypothetical protein
VVQLASLECLALQVAQESAAAQVAQVSKQFLHFPESNQVPALHFPLVQVALSVHAEQPVGQASHFLSELMIYPMAQAEHSAFGGVEESNPQVLQLSTHLEHFPKEEKYPSAHLVQVPMNFPHLVLSLQLVAHYPQAPAADKTG